MLSYARLRRFSSNWKFKRIVYIIKYYILDKHTEIIHETVWLAWPDLLEVPEISGRKESCETSLLALRPELDARAVNIEMNKSQYDSAESGVWSCWVYSYLVRNFSIQIFIYYQKNIQFSMFIHCRNEQLKCILYHIRFIIIINEE